MVKACCVRNCDIGPKGNVVCFRFPNNRVLRRQWVDAVGLSNKLCGSSTVCIQHFQPDDYDMVRGRPRLKARVVPSVFCKADNGPVSPCATEDDVISNEIDPSITLNNLQKDGLSLQVDEVNSTDEGRTVLQNEIATEIHDDGSTQIEKGGEENTPNKSSSVAEKQGRLSQDVGSAKSLDEDRSDVNTVCGGNLKHGGDDEVSVKSKDKNKTEVSNEIIEVQIEGNTKLTSDSGTKLSDEGSKLIEIEISAHSICENGDIEEEIDKIRRVKPNGVVMKEKEAKNGYQDSFIESATGKQSVAVGADELTNDIEDIIVNYQIKQTRPLHCAEVLSETELGFDDDFGKERDPVFIELAVQGAGDRTADRDCLMVLESVQVELDPSSFLLGEALEGSETVELDDEDERENRRQDPISLLTSSDEDEVIIQEPHIDTVEVSDETDEDDVPLVKLLKKAKKNKKKKPKIAIWNPYEYFCMDCQFTASSSQEYKEHTAKHSTILQVCEICDYTTASKSQFSRHKRKHKDDKKFKCHLCEYKARHNMSLIYHLKSHRALSSVKNGFKCDKCGFKSDVKSLVLKHVKLCASDVKKYSCDQCVYETKRPSDLRRHQQRRHNRCEEFH